MAKLFTQVGMEGSTGVCKISGISASVLVPVLSGLFSLPVPSGDLPVPDEDPAPMAELISFRFGTAVEDGDSNTAVFDPFERGHIEPYRGSAIITDGISLNREYDGANAVNLEIEAPESAPTVALAGTGLTATNVTWRYRYLASKTGKVSGISPASGAESPADETATVTAAVSSDPQVDVVQFFRCFSDDTNLWYLVGEEANSGTPAYADTTSEDDLESGEVHILNEGRAFNVGRMWPVTRSLNHLGRMYYYGLVRMRPYSAGTVAVTNAANTITGTGTKMTNARLGQRFTVSGDTTEYTIISVISSTSWKVYPAIARGSDTGLTYEVEDNRDGRLVRIANYSYPGNVPYAQSFSLGADISDVVHFMGRMGGALVALTYRTLNLIQGDQTEEPWLSVTSSVLAQEGCAGPHAAVLVPGLGLIFVDPILGPRVFNGERTAFLGTPQRLDIEAEWLRVRDTRKREIVLAYDSEQHHVVMSYARDDDSALNHQLVYDANTGIWVGPWTRPVFTHGALLDVDGTSRQVLGSHLGSLSHDHVGTRDGRDSGDLSGTLTGVSGRVFTDSSASLNTDDDGLYAAAVEFQSPSGTTVTALIVSNTGTAMTTLNLPDPMPEVGWTYRIAPIEWIAKSGYLDFGDPGKPKDLNKVRFRCTKGTSGSVRIAFGKDGDSLTAADREIDVTGNVYGEFRGNLRGYALQFQFSGSGAADTPEITQVVAMFDVRDGEIAQ